MSTQSSLYDVIVIGGGAAGMMAAATSARSGARVLLIEKNQRLGEKLRISGGGRCNVFNDEEDTRTLLQNYGNSERYLYSAFSQFGVQESRDYFESTGLQLNRGSKTRFSKLRQSKRCSKSA